jgi:glucose dehydrogenase
LVLFLFGAILAGAVIAGCGGSGGTVTTDASAPTPITAAPEFTADELYEAAGDNWITNGGGTTNDRFSSLDEINTENVK